MPLGMSWLTIFLAMMFKGLVMGAYTLITGKEMFPANPKGPLYKWFGGASHESSPALPQPLSRGQSLARLSERPSRPRAPRFRVSKPPR